jgi:hypothetical protein
MKTIFIGNNHISCNNAGGIATAFNECTKFTTSSLRLLRHLLNVGWGHNEQTHNVRIK